MRPLTGTDYDRLRRDGHARQAWPSRHYLMRERVALVVYVVVLPVAALLTIALLVGGAMVVLRIVGSLIRSLGGPLP